MKKLTKKGKTALICGCIAAGAGLIALVLWFWLWHPEIHISEVSPSNGGSSKAALTDRNGDKCDWIELSNATDKERSLDGFSLSKEGKERFSLDGVKIPANGNIIVYCSKAGFDDEFKGAHADFNISKTGEDTIVLSYHGSEVEKVKLPQLDKGASYSRNADGKYYVSEQTPAAENAKDSLGDTVRFSKKGGYYSKGFDLKLSAGEGQTIFYTLDGTDPAASSTSTEYNGAISVDDRSGEENVLSAIDPQLITNDYNPGKVFLPKNDDVDKATVVRACAVGTSGKAGKTVTETFFVGLSPKDHNKLPVISVVTDPENLFDYETGIYTFGKVFDDYKAEHTDVPKNGSVPANYNQRGREWEKACHIEYYSEKGDMLLSQDCGMRIQGGWSRAEYQKSLRFYARGDCGAKSFKLPLFDGLTDSEGKKIKSYDTFVLRNGGNDTNYSKFKDPMLQSMVSGRLPDTQAGKACVLFIDGEYWGLYTLTQDYSEEYFSEKYGVPEDEVVFVKSDELDIGKESDMKLYTDMAEFITQNDMSAAENYQKACELIDMDSFIEYCAIEMYIFNTDWPQNNFACWRTRAVSGEPYQDGKWRFCLYDTESSCDHYNEKYINKSEFLYISEREGEGIADIILSLMKNEEFAARLGSVMVELGENELSYDNYKKTVGEYKQVYYAELLNYYKRFPTWASREECCDKMLERMDRFFKIRLENIKKALDAEGIKY